MDKSKAQITGLVLFSLLTAGIGQAMILAPAPAPSHRAAAPREVRARLVRPRAISLPSLKERMQATFSFVPLPGSEWVRGAS